MSTPMRASTGGLDGVMVHMGLATPTPLPSIERAFFSPDRSSQVAARAAAPEDSGKVRRRVRGCAVRKQPLLKVS
jgi:hypothetical protein